MQSPAETLSHGERDPEAVGQREGFYSPEAEQAMLGGLIAYPGQMGDVDGVEAHLHDPRHRLIFATMRDMAGKGEEIDAVTLNARLALSGRLGDAGGSAYLMGLVDGCGRLHAAGEYADVVRRYGVRRGAATAATRYVQALAKGTPVDGEADALRMALDGAERGLAGTEGTPRMLIEVRAAAVAAGAIPRIPTSIPGLDGAIGGGYMPGWTVIFGAFTGGGKTSICTREAIHHAAKGHPVLIVSLELSAMEVAGRIDQAATPGVELPIWIFADTCDLDAIHQCIQRWVKELRETDPKVLTPIVIVDYLQLVQAGRQQTREREVAIATQTLQRGARKGQYVLIAAAQFNRQSQGEERPQLHHMRESGQIEQSADLALLIAKDGEDRLWAKIAKARWGGAGVEFDLSCDFKTCRLGVMEEYEKYKALSDAVCNYLRLRAGHAKMRDLLMTVKWNGNKHPKRAEVYDAARACRGYEINGNDVKVLEVCVTTL